MKALSLLLLTCSLAANASAQTPQEVPGVAVTQHKWRQELRIPALLDDPFRANDEQREWVVAQRQTSRQNAARERGGQNALPPPPRVNGGYQNANPEDNQRTVVPQPVRKPGRAWVEYLYEVKVSNTGTKPIRAVVWEYVVSDPETRRELGNHLFLSKVEIAPGKSKKLTGLTESHPAQIVEAAKGEKQPRAQYAENVVIHRVEYADGTVWERASN